MNAWLLLITSCFWISWDCECIWNGMDWVGVVLIIIIDAHIKRQSDKMRMKSLLSLMRFGVFMEHAGTVLCIHHPSLSLHMQNQTPVEFQKMCSQTHIAAMLLLNLIIGICIQYHKPNLEFAENYWNLTYDTAKNYCYQKSETKQNKKPKTAHKWFLFVRDSKQWVWKLEWNRETFA